MHDGAAALEQAPAWQPDIVLLDIGLPGMDGYEVARRLRADAALAGTLLVTGAAGARPRGRSDAAATAPAAATVPVAPETRLAEPPA